MFIQPLSLLYQTALYGSAAIVIREIVRRRNLGWLNIFLLGAAYGILEEGLVVTSWFNPYWPDLGILSSYGRFLDISWVWATELTVYHAIVSIAIPILLVEILFPRIAQQPWLGKHSLRALISWLTVASLAGLVGFGFLFFRDLGYTHPPLMYLAVLCFAAGLTWLGLHLRPRTRPAIYMPTPGLWGLRISAFLATAAFFFISWAVPHLHLPPLIPILLIVALVVFAGRQIANWSRQPAWDVTHKLALASGVLSFFIFLSPIIEFITHPDGKNFTGQTFVGMVWLVILISLTLWAKRVIINTALYSYWTATR